MKSSSISARNWLGSPMAPSAIMRAISRKAGFWM